MDQSAKDQGPVQRPSNHLFEDPAIALAAKDDPIAQFMVKNWRTILGVLIAIPCVIFAYNTYKATNEAKRAAASALFGEVREALGSVNRDTQELATTRNELDSAVGAKKDELIKKVADLEVRVRSGRERLGKMTESLSDTAIEPFPQLARLYQGILAARSGDLAEVKGVLSGVNWENVTPPDSRSRMVAELSALVLGRAYLDSPDGVKEGRQILSSLAEKGSFARTQALQALLASSDSPEDKAAAVALAEKLKSEQPEQEKFFVDLLQ